MLRRSQRRAALAAEPVPEPVAVPQPKKRRSGRQTKKQKEEDEEEHKTQEPLEEDTATSSRTMSEASKEDDRTPSASSDVSVELGGTMDSIPLENEEKDSSQSLNPPSSIVGIFMDDIEEEEELGTSYEESLKETLREESEEVVPQSEEPLPPPSNSLIDVVSLSPLKEQQRQRTPPPSLNDDVTLNLSLYTPKKEKECPLYTEHGSSLSMTDAIRGIEEKEEKEDERPPMKNEERRQEEEMENGKEEEERREDNLVEEPMDCSRTPSPALRTEEKKEEKGEEKTNEEQAPVEMVNDVPAEKSGVEKTLQPPSSDDLPPLPPTAPPPSMPSLDTVPLPPGGPPYSAQEPEKEVFWPLNTIRTTPTKPMQPLKHGPSPVPPPPLEYGGYGAMRYGPPGGYGPPGNWGMGGGPGMGRGMGPPNWGPYGNGYYGGGGGGGPMMGRGGPRGMPPPPPTYRAGGGYGYGMNAAPAPPPPPPPPPPPAEKKEPPQPDAMDVERAKKVMDDAMEQIQRKKEEMRLQREKEEKEKQLQQDAEDEERKKTMGKQNQRLQNLLKMSTKRVVVSSTPSTTVTPSENSTTQKEEDKSDLLPSLSKGVFQEGTDGDEDGKKKGLSLPSEEDRAVVAQFEKDHGMSAPVAPPLPVPPVSIRVEKPPVEAKMEEKAKIEMGEKVTHPQPVPPPPAIFVNTSLNVTTPSRSDQASSDSSRSSPRARKESERSRKDSERERRDSERSRERSPRRKRRSRSRSRSRDRDRRSRDRDRSRSRSRSRSTDRKRSRRHSPPSRYGRSGERSGHRGRYDKSPVRGSRSRRRSRSGSRERRRTRSRSRDRERDRSRERKRSGERRKEDREKERKKDEDRKEKEKRKEDTRDKEEKNEKEIVKETVEVVEEKKEEEEEKMDVEEKEKKEETTAEETEVSPPVLCRGDEEEEDDEMGSEPPTLHPMPLLCPEKEEDKEIKENVDLSKDVKMPSFDSLLDCEYISTPRDHTDYGGPCLCHDKSCGTSCLRRCMLVECGNRCPSGKACTNRRFQNHENAPVEAFYTGPGKGWGLRATANIKKGTFLLEYVGEVVNEKEYEKRKKQYGRDKSHQHHYLMSVSDSNSRLLVIDATKKGNISRFINHGCEPNAFCEKWSVNRRFRVGFFALRNITAGEEVNFDYKFQNYGRKQQECACGAPSCRKFIGEKEKDDDRVIDDSDDDDESDEDEDEDEEEEEDSDDDAEIRRQLARENEALRSSIAVDEMIKKGMVKNKIQMKALLRLMIRVVSVPLRISLIQHLSSSVSAAPEIFRSFISENGLRIVARYISSSPKEDSSSSSPSSSQSSPSFPSMEEYLQSLLLQKEVIELLSQITLTSKNQVTTDSDLLPNLQSIVAGSPPEGLIIRDILDGMCEKVCEEEEEGIEKRTNIEEAYAAVVKEAQEVIHKWSTLKANFKIPKKLTNAHSQSFEKTEKIVERKEERRSANVRPPLASSLSASSALSRPLSISASTSGGWAASSGQPSADDSRRGNGNGFQHSPRFPPRRKRDISPPYNDSRRDSTAGRRFDDDRPYNSYDRDSSRDDEWRENRRGEKRRREYDEEFTPRAVGGADATMPPYKKPPVPSSPPDPAQRSVKPEIVQENKQHFTPPPPSRPSFDGNNTYQQQPPYSGVPPLGARGGPRPPGPPPPMPPGYWGPMRHPMEMAQHPAMAGAYGGYQDWSGGGDAWAPNMYGGYGQWPGMAPTRNLHGELQYWHDMIKYANDQIVQIRNSLGLPPLPSSSTPSTSTASSLTSSIPIPSAAPPPPPVEPAKEEAKDTVASEPEAPLPVPAPLPVQAPKAVQPVALHDTSTRGGRPRTPPMPDEIRGRRSGSRPPSSQDRKDSHGSISVSRRMSGVVEDMTTASSRPMSRTGEVSIHSKGLQPSQPKTPGKRANYCIVHMEDGEVYYYHKITRDAVWELPPGEEATEEDDAEVEEPAARSQTNEREETATEEVTTSVTELDPAERQEKRAAFKDRSTGLLKSFLKVTMFSDVKEYKYTLRKVNHAILEKEERNPKFDYRLGTSVRNRIIDYVNKYIDRHALKKRAQEVYPDGLA